MGPNTAVEVGVPKLGNCLEMYTCAQARAQFVHNMCTSLDTPCTLEHCLDTPCTLEHCLDTPCTLEVYTCLGTGLGTCVHFQAVSKLGHSNFYSSVNFIHCKRPKTNDSPYIGCTCLVCIYACWGLKYTRRRAPASRYIV